jgi:formylglycine-generating enzyme required for sulfatase activity
MSTAKPVIFLAFANDYSDDQTRYLRELREETRALQAILEEAQQQGWCEVVVRPYATIDDILDVFLNYPDRIAIFHFAGHANGYQLLLESAEGQVAVADAGGLAAFLGQQEGLQLVFLNGCSTRQQVEGLLEVGIPAVIATSWAIDDRTAVDFASRFYAGLAKKAPLRRAYNQAEAAIKIVQGNDFRGALRRVQEAPQDSWPWGLYSQEGSEVADLWSLVTYDQFQPGQSLLPYEPETVLIPAGPFVMGSAETEEGAKDYEMPQHTVELPAYRIGKYPVTNGEYAEFIRQTGQPVAHTAGWEGQIPTEDKLDHPVIGITWYNALAYCKWLSEQTGRAYTLPVEAQWEKAARGADGRIYPWGNEWHAGYCNHNSGQITPKDAYPEGVSPYKCYDMIGNVREWTRTIWGVRRHRPQFCYPQINDSRDDLKATRLALRIYRGGAATDPVAQLRCSARNGYFPDKPGPPEKRHGFRVAIEL